MVSRIATGATVALAALLLSSPVAGEGEASAQVERLHAALLSVMKQARALGYEGRRAELAPVVRESFDFDFMARLAIGHGWRDLDEERRARWVTTFEDFSISTYAARFDGYSGQRFETLEVAEAPHDTRIVKTRLVIPDEEPVNLHYRVRQSDERWRIIDVYLNGTVSEVALRRSEFTSVLARQGFDSLLAELRNRIDRNASPVPAAPRS